MSAKNISLMICRALLGAIFIFAGVTKIIDPAQFAQDIDNYRMLPYILATVMAVILPWVEVIVGVLLVCGRWLKSSSLIVILLNVVFIIAIASAMIRGLDINCGCFSDGASAKVGFLKLLEDCVYLGLAVIVFRSGDIKTSKV